MRNEVVPFFILSIMLILSKHRRHELIAKRVRELRTPCGIRGG